MRSAQTVKTVVHRTGDTHRTLLGLAAGAAAFVGMQVLAEAPLGQGGGFRALVGAAVGYLSLAAPTALVARGGMPRMAVLLPLCYFVIPSIVELLLRGEFGVNSHLPGMASYEPLEGWPVFRSVLYLALIALPALSTPAPGRRSPRRLGGPMVSGLTICGAAVLVLLYVTAVVSRGPLELGIASATVACAVLLTFQQSATAPLRILAGVWTSGLVAYVIGLATSGWSYMDLGVLQEFAILAIIPAVLGSSPRVGEIAARATKRPLVLLVLVNALNVADALLTIMGESRGTLVETNPLVAELGLIPKVVGVALASWLAYRLRPRWLLVPAIVLACVLIYHAGGLVL
jgi:hypothetical protein